MATLTLREAAPKAGDVVHFDATDVGRVRRGWRLEVAVLVTSGGAVVLQGTTTPGTGVTVPAGQGSAQLRVVEMKGPGVTVLDSITFEVAAAPVAATFSTRLAVGVNDTVWERSITSAADKITTVTRADGVKVFRAKAGGHAPNANGSTFARYRAKLPEVYGIAPRGWFKLSAKIRLLTSADHYYSFLRTDNYVGTLKGTTTKVGCATGGEWRVGLMMQPGNVVEFQSTHQGGTTLVLWRGSLLPGDHVVSFALDPKADATGSWSLTIDGVTRTGTGQTVPSPVPVAERVVTRVVTCIDGANKWTEKAVEVEVVEAAFETTN